MKSNTVINSLLVIVGFILAFGVGYLIWGTSDNNQTKEPIEEESKTEEQPKEEAEDTENLAQMIPEDAEALSRNSCLGCHSVESLDAPGGDVGPDLSRVFPEMKEKHGKELDEFLQDPTSAVMATVIADKPLDDEEREQIVKALEKAAEKRKTSSETKENADDSN